MGLFDDLPPAKETAEYYLAVVPPEPLRTEIRDMQNLLYNQFGTKGALFSPPHITLVNNFSIELEKEDALIEWLTKEEGKFDSFTQRLNGFKKYGFETIYIGVEEGERLKTMGKALSQGLYAFWKQRGIEKRVKSCRDPHLTIGPSYLLSGNFDAIWAAFENKPYCGSFLVENICLLKRKKKGEKWTEFLYLPLKGVRS